MYDYIDENDTGWSLNRSRLGRGGKEEEGGLTNSSACSELCYGRVSQYWCPFGTGEYAQEGSVWL
jgi:hypothetical protein